ncbi:MAG: Unknown protein [uncultured Sulfurovum sp.]|uniref:Outer membrane protein beta-barrel domain-containing protein n=1 Tax=uncultured Sulfurovum sp. TaxID=269237 RepID=A0A6S6TT67_9BACT|nr:MAG: Unknown protein [uncultured Sulfurovum sp.]
MRKIFLLFLCSLPLLPNTLSDVLGQKLSGKSFVNLGVVQQTSRDYHNAQALNLTYSFVHRNHFGIDISYTQSIDEAKHKITTKSADLSSLSILPTYMYPLDKNIAIKGKLGYAKNKHAEDGLSYGAELIFQITKIVGFSFTYQQMNKDMTYLMINTVYRLKQ